ncbi:MAG: RNA polymerase sigma-54 factor RpoN [Rhodobacteraceae bacterium HLUCCA08]|nr:MAG: RNA polymerase sigma-54 factor RpoN [Rhodobacteraceae bacterium HLUCCA08]
MSVTLGLVHAQRHGFLLQQSTLLLRMSTAELSEFLSDAAQTNPLLLVECRQRRFYIRSSTADLLEAMGGEDQQSLYAHVAAELGRLISQGGLLARIIGRLIEELEPSGWIGVPLSGIARETGVREAHVEAVLRLVQQQVDPCGLFARNLQECLRLQLEAQGPIGDDMQAVLDHLGVLEKHGISGLAREAGIDCDAARACVDALRRLDPKPGARFARDPTLARAPDATVVRGQKGWEIVFNSASRPVIKIATLPRQSARSKDLSRLLQEARGLKQAMDLRVSATRKIVATLVARQHAYFDAGLHGLQPLAMGELAVATGFHASTVSRVLNGFLIEGPHGVIAARDLCARAASTAQSAPSRPQVMARLRAILASEDAQDPIKDTRLREILLAEGISISRRMVTRYRELCGFASAASRRRRS